jgi:hypothetical protein
MCPQSDPDTTYSLRGPKKFTCRDDNRKDGGQHELLTSPLLIGESRVNQMPIQ